ncbi:mRNA turnover protein 4-like [Penaeus vannamei]|uniref:Ribosome assembly factor mrt4 n=1 Tax=Penaeus vannamei TaxID=6689 RepID=A0A3R7SY86_PENVA|nr:mRNA turnover protein 4-like [Penaeus vannamei]
MALALGRTPEEELHENLYKLSQKLVGQCGLLFTNAEKEEVLEYFETRKYPVSPNSGDIATETIELKAGLLEQFPHCMEPHLRKLGLPTRLQRGIPELLQDFTVCTEGKPLTANQANILVTLEGSPRWVRVTSMRSPYHHDTEPDPHTYPHSPPQSAGGRLSLTYAGNAHRRRRQPIARESPRPDQSGAIPAIDPVFDQMVSGASPGKDLKAAQDTREKSLRRARAENRPSVGLDPVAKISS